MRAIVVFRRTTEEVVVLLDLVDDAVVERRRATFLCPAPDAPYLECADRSELTLADPVGIVRAE